VTETFFTVSTVSFVVLILGFNTTKYKRFYSNVLTKQGGSVAEWLACWTQAQNTWVQIAASMLSVTVLGKLLIPIVPLFTKQQSW